MNQGAGSKVYAAVLMKQKMMKGFVTQAFQSMGGN